MPQDYAKAREWFEKAAARNNSQAMTNLSYLSLFVKDFAGALSASEEAISLLPTNLAPITNKAHALMFLGRAEEARELYLTHKGQRVAEGIGLWKTKSSRTSTSLKRPV